MNDRIYAVLIGIAAVAVSVLASVLAVDNLTERTLEQAMTLGQVKGKIEGQRQELKNTEKALRDQQRSMENTEKALRDQQKSIGDLKTQLQILMKEATGLSEGKEAHERLQLLRALSEELGSSPMAEKLLSLKSRVEALTDPERMDCSTETVQFGPNESCYRHVDWIPRAACPVGKSIRSIDIVPDQLRGGGWGCGFKIECCSNVGVHAERTNN